MCISTHLLEVSFSMQRPDLMNMSDHSIGCTTAIEVFSPALTAGVQFPAQTFTSLPTCFRKTSLLLEEVPSGFE